MVKSPFPYESDRLSPSRREFLRLGAGVSISGAALAMTGLSFAAGRGEQRIVETVQGKLRGTVKNGVAAFKGVHYGESTAGKNRFLPARPVKPWAGIRDATRLGHPCVQDNPDFAAWLDPMPGSEDCLVLNVWSPETASPSSKLPVMVWIHGGGYAFGSGGAPLYDGRNLARIGDVVVVGLNHRLQSFGFSDLGAAGEAFADSGNVGQLDLLAALEWVRANIGVFGGDAGNVTLFGQSGGGAKISTLMAMPAARGLFHKAIVQSGSVFRYRTPEEARRTSDRMFAILGIRKNDVAALQAIPAAALNKCGEQIISETAGVGNNVLVYAPIVDGRTISSVPWQSESPEWARDMPLLLGSTHDETIIYVTEDMWKSLAGGGATFEGLVDAVVGATTVRTPDRAHVKALLPAYREALGDVSDLELIVRMSTDIGFWKGALHQADLHAATGAPVYMYGCDWKTPCFDGQWAPHAMEIPFVMGHHEYGPAWDGKDSDAQRAAADPGNLRLKLSDQMLAAWANFARSGDPSQPGLAWERFDSEGRSTMIFDRDTRVVKDPRGRFRQLVQGAPV